MKQTNISKGVVAAAAAGLLAAGGWTVWKQSAVKVSVETDPNAGTSIKFQPTSPQPSASSSSTASDSDGDSDQATNSSPQAAVPSAAATPQVPQKDVDVYNNVELTDRGIKVLPTNIPIKEASKSKEGNLQTAFDEMLNNKATGKNTKTGSNIPKGTKLLSLRTAADDVYIDLSKEFTGNASTTNSHVRLAQVFLTATRFNRNANVWISVEGQKLEELGGLEVPSPLTRQQFKKAFPMVDLGK